jgi:hypothetical protein
MSDHHRVLLLECHQNVVLTIIAIAIVISIANYIVAIISPQLKEDRTLIETESIRIFVLVLVE